MGNEKKIAVYFTNGKRAVFDESELTIRGGDKPPREEELTHLTDVTDAGKTVVNWNNVCFARLYMEEEDS